MFCGNCFREIEETDVCPWCGYDMAAARVRYPLALKPGSILNGRYVVGRPLGQGGFGITYIAEDDRRKVRVAIKEYYPSDLSARAAGTSTIIPFPGEREEFFRFGMQKFREEAQALGAFRDNEHIVRIRNYFEENGTAYFAMEYVEGRPLDAYVKERGGRLAPEEADSLLMPLMEALEQVHAKGIVHRDIAPDNIIVQPDGQAKLIDFGAARYSTGEKSKSLDVVVKNGYAPYEQYLRRSRQGPFTDVYSMAATYYYAITGITPPESVARYQEDLLVPPRNLAVRIGEQAENALLKALEIEAPDRFQTMGEFRRAMYDPEAAVPAREEAPQPPAPATPVSRAEERLVPEPEPEPVPEPPKKRGAPKWLYAAIPAALLAVILPIALKDAHGGEETVQQPPAAVAVTAEPAQQEEETISEVSEPEEVPSARNSALPTVGPFYALPNAPGTEPTAAPNSAGPGPDDMAGCDKRIVKPKDTSWLSDYEIRYVDVFHDRIGYLCAKPHGGRIGSIKEKTEVVLLAVENGYGLVKKNGLCVGWVNMDYLVEEYTNANHS